jgi:preprotein translocase subunit SecF
MVLILGIGIGTFSSIFVASPVLVNIEEKWPPQTKKATGSGVRTQRRATAPG